MSFFSKLFGAKNDPSSYKFRLERARSLHGMPVDGSLASLSEREEVVFVKVWV